MVIVNKKLEFEAVAVAASNLRLASCLELNYFGGDGGSDDQPSSDHSFLVDYYYYY